LSFYKPKSFQKIDEILPKLLKPMVEGKKTEFLIINNLIKNWSQIVGLGHFQSCKIKQIQLQKPNFQPDLSPDKKSSKQDSFDNYSGNFSNKKSKNLDEEILEVETAQNPTEINLQSQEHKNFSKPCLALTIAAFDSATAFYIKNDSQLIAKRIKTLYGSSFDIKITVKNQPKSLENQAKWNFYQPQNNDLSLDYKGFVADKNSTKLESPNPNFAKISSYVANISDPNLAEILTKLAKKIL